MATNTAGDVGQLYSQNMVHYLAKTITYADDDATVIVGTLPPSAVVIEAGIVVTTAFSANSVLDIGVVGADTDAYGTALVCTTAGRIIDTAINANDDYSTSSVQIGAYLTSSGTISAGSGVVYVMYILADR